MKTVIHTIRKHHVLTEIVLVGFAVIAFVISAMITLPNDGAAQRAGASQAQYSEVTPGGSDPAGS
jgi:hypothetical protein